MIREQKNKFWLTLILILSLSFSAVALGVTSIFSNREEDVAVAAVAQVQEDDTTMSVSKWIDSNGNEKTDLINLSGGSTFVVEKKTTQKDASGTYDVSDVERTAVNEAEDLSYISNYTITINGTKYSPVPYNGYRVTGFNFYDEKDVQLENVTSGTIYSEQIDPNYTGKIIVKAVCEPIDYKVYMYYSTTGTEWLQQVQTFQVGSTTSLEFESLTAYAGGNVHAFKSWAVKAGVGETLDTANKVLKIGNIEFSYSLATDGSTPEKIEDGRGNVFYRVNKVTGFSSKINNFEENNYSGSANYASTSPAIRATWSYIYDGLINNTATNSVDSTKVGAFSTGDADADANEATLKLAADADNFGFGFYNNTKNAFQTDSAELLSLANSFGVSSKFYYVYNYGYEITGWNVYFDLEGNYHADYSSNAWSVSAGAKTKINISNLSDANMSDLAKSLDAFFVAGYPAGTTINIEPTWQAVSVNIVANFTQASQSKTLSIATVDYNGTYSISDSAVYVDPGKSIYYYITTNNNIIAKQHTANKSIKFNYVNLPQGDFIYNSSYSCYDLNVQPYSVDNIYKVSLIGDATYSNRLYKSNVSGSYTYQLKDLEPLTSISNNQYEFVKKTTESSYLTIATVPGLTKTYSDYSTGSVETYIDSYIVPIRDEYETKIADGSLSVLRKVYTTGDVESALIYTSLSAEDSFFIYLANNQDAGYLPIFERNSYDLTAWDNLGDISYKTKSYDEEAHKNDFAGRLLKDPKVKAEYCTYYDLSNSDTLSNLVLEAHYFRKNYLLDLNTLREGAQEGRYGYIYIEINDIAESDPALNKSGKFIAIHNGVEMQYFKATSASLAGISGSALTASQTGLIREKDGVLLIAYYAGCNLTIKASCVDSLTNSDADLIYKDMVGYYLSSVTTTNDCNSNQLFTDVSYATIENKRNGNTTIYITDEDVNGNDSGNVGKNYKTNTKIVIDANFAPINYELTISLKSGTTPANAVLNTFAGRVDCLNQSTTTTNAVLTYSLDVNVENWHQTISYFANAAGYTLQNEAITIVGLDGKHVLLAYNSNVATSETNSQEYPFLLNGEWLLNNYYATEYVATTAVEGVTTQSQTLDVSVNTELLTFDYYVDIVKDGVELTSYKNGTVKLNGSVDSVNIAIINVNDLKNSLSNGNKEFDVVSKLLVASEFEKISADENFYIIKHGGKKYVVLTSSLSQIMDGRNYLLDYNFLLRDTDITSTGDTLTQERINSIYGIGNIVAPEDRILRMQINVSELYTITMKAQAHANPDPCSSERTTTIKNHQDAYGALTNSATLTTSGSNFNNTQIIYTYKGVENHISSAYNTDHYNGVLYTFEGGLSNLEENVFILDPTMVDANNNKTILITYVPKPVTVFSVTYQRNGMEDSSIIGSIIEEIQKPNSEIELYFNQGVTYEYKLINPEYIATVSLNGVTVDANPVVCKVTDSVLNAGGFYLVVNVKDLPKGMITLKYQLEDITYSCESDDYGTFEVLIDDIYTPLNDAGDGWYSVYVVEDKSVKIDISGLNKGYHFVKLGTNTQVEDNKVLITSSFDLDDDRVYYIVIAKDTVRATLTVEGDYKNKYVMTTTNIATNSVSAGVSTIDAYIGKTLTFTYVDENREILDYYYYSGFDSYGDNVEFRIDGNAEVAIELTINSAVLNNLADKENNVWTLNLGVKRTPKYNLTYNIINAVNIETFDMFELGEPLMGGLNTIVGDYVSGTNLIMGTSVSFDVVVKNNKIDDFGTIVEAKYNIVLSGCINSTITSGSASEIIVLDEDKVLTITITPKTYNDTEYAEFMYYNLEAYKNLTPDELTTQIGGFEINSNLAYGSTADASLNLVDAASGELAVVRLSGNDSNTLVVHLKGKKIVSVYDETNDVEYVIAENYAKHSAATTEVVNPVDVLLLKGYSFGFAADVDKLNISYTVKNVISIKAEYISYKTITPMI